jgi:hypothetical protein
LRVGEPGTPDELEHPDAEAPAPVVQEAIESVKQAIAVIKAKEIVKTSEMANPDAGFRQMKELGCRDVLPFTNFTIEEL